MPHQKRTIIIIAGPTAVGKTAVALSIAKHLNTQIISADSRQCYKELKIGVARPSVQELSEVQHYFIASHSVEQKIDAALFEQYALEKLNTIFEHHNTAVVVGGTGLYIKALGEGIDLIPEVSQTIREQIINGYDHNGLLWLQEQMKTADPKFYKTGEIQNPHRMMRALEVVWSTGKSILDFRTGAKAERPFKVIKLALALPKETLRSNINSRVDNMMEAGLVNEVKTLISYRHLNALQTVGYKELFDYLKGDVSLQVAIELIQQHTRQYAKRQITWFKKDKEYTWFEATENKEILSFVEKKLRE